MSTDIAAALLSYDNDTEAVEDIERHQWSDGLPVVLPTPERVADMLSASSAASDEMLGLMPTHWYPTYVHHVAVNAVMAGCAPKHFPVVLAGVRAVLDDRFNLYGPVRDAIHMNYSHNLFGQGNRANATIGRAVRLCLINIGGGRPKSGDMSTLGNPNKFGSCIAEDEASSPWDPLHVARGYQLDDSVVTVHSATAPLNVITMSDDGEAVINMLAGALATPGGNAMFLEQEIMVVLGPTQAHRVARAGYSRAGVEEELWRRGARSLEGLAETDERAIRDWRRNSLFVDNGAEYVHPTATPDMISVVVAGGEGPHSAVVTGFNGGRIVSVPVAA
jgi:hypothetical protein